MAKRHGWTLLLLLLYVLFVLASAAEAPLVDLKPRLVKPPFGSVQVDWGHPLANHLVFCSLLNPSPVDLVTGTISSPSTTLAWASSLKGPGVLFDTTQKFNYVDHTIWQPGSTPYGISLVVIANPISEATSRALIGKQLQVSPFTGYWLEVNVNELEGIVAGKIHFEIRNGPSQRRGAASDTTGVDGSYHMFGGRYDGFVSDLADVFKDGQLVTNTRSTLSGMAAITDTTSLNVGDAGSGTNQEPFNKTIIYACLWHRSLTNSEFLWLFAEPYAFLRPVPGVVNTMQASQVAAAGTPFRTLLGVGLFIWMARRTIRTRRKH